MTPTGSCPTILPGATGYSPFRMCTSVPQIVVSVTRSSASVGPTSGIGRSWMTMRPGRSKTAAFMVFFIVVRAHPTEVLCAEASCIPRRSGRARCVITREHSDRGTGSSALAGAKRTGAARTRESLTEFIHALPIRQFVIARRIRRTTLLSRDPFHDPANERRVLRVSQRAAKRGHEVWAPVARGQELFHDRTG